MEEKHGPWRSTGCTGAESRAAIRSRVTQRLDPAAHPRLRDVDPEPRALCRGLYR